MDIVNEIAKDHREIEDLLRGIPDNSEDRQFRVSQLRLRYSAHNVAKQVHVYPELSGDPEIAEVMRGLVDDYNAGESSLRVVESEVGSPRFDTAIADFADALNRQFIKEESVLLPRLRDELDNERSGELGRRFELRRLAEMEVRVGSDAPEEEPPS